MFSPEIDEKKLYESRLKFDGFPVTDCNGAVKAVDSLKSDFKVKNREMAYSIRVSPSQFWRWKRSDGIAEATKTSITNLVIRFLNTPQQKMLEEDLARDDSDSNFD